VSNDTLGPLSVRPKLPNIVPTPHLILPTCNTAPLLKAGPFHIVHFFHDQRAGILTARLSAPAHLRQGQCDVGRLGET
jgi:hypothetical protein